MIPPLALFTNLGDWLLRGLAVVGAVAVGGFLAGLIVQLAARLTTTKPAPRRLVQLMRLLGAITGLVIALYLFPGSGPGGGGSGKDGGKDSGQGKYATSEGKETPPKEQQAKSDLAAEQAEMRVVVINSSDGRNYRIEGDSKAHTLEEVKERITKRSIQKPPLRRLVIVLYEDSPDQDTRIVQQLEALAKDNDLTPETAKPKGTVPESAR